LKILQKDEDTFCRTLLLIEVFKSKQTTIVWF